MSEGPEITNRWFQFTLKRMLLATFWMAVCFGGVIANRSISPQWDFLGPVMLRKCLMFVTFYIGGLSPFIAVGALLGRAKTGAVIGFIAISAILAVLSTFVLFDPGWNQSPDERSLRITDCALSCLLLAAGISTAFLCRYLRLGRPQNS